MIQRTRPMARGKPPRNRKRLQRTAFIRRRNRKAVRAGIRERTQKQRREFERMYGSEERITWVRSLPSVVSGYDGMGPCVGHHIKTGGTGRKADACWIVPLTDREHRELHRMGVQSFEAKYKVNLERAAKATEQAWQEYQVEMGAV